MFHKSLEFVQLTILFFLFLADAQFFRGNAPPILSVERTWEIPDDEPVGSIISRAKASDDENDPIVFSLELNDPNYRNPFIINETTGVVKLNESLENRVKIFIFLFIKKLKPFQDISTNFFFLLQQGGEKFLLSVIAFDGNVNSRSEVYVKIINTSATTPRSPSNRPQRPPYYPTYLVPSVPLVPPSNPFPPKVPTVTNRPKQKTEGKTVTTVKKGLLNLYNSSLVSCIEFIEV